MSFHPTHRVCGRRSPLLIIALVGFALLASGPARARAGVREAIKRALPATVCVEQRDASGSAANELTMATGALVSTDGLVVTMIQRGGGNNFRVTLADGHEVAGKLVVDDRRTGLKLVKIESANLSFLTPDAEGIPIGEDIVATYCVDLKQRAVARGIVAAVDREVAESSGGLLQLDINVGPMSAGCPIVDDEGRLRGIIGYQKADSGHSATFALPASRIVALLQARRDNSLTIIRRGRLGVQQIESEGKVIAHPINGGAAIAAGLREGDEMLALDDVKLKRYADLTRFMSQHAAGDKVRLAFRRGGKEQTIDVTLAPAPEDNEQSAIQNLKVDLNVVTPGQFYVTEKNGNLNLLQGLDRLFITGQGSQSVQGRQLLVTTLTAPPAAKHGQEGGQVSTPSIRVERSNVEKKLEQIGRDVLTLRQQMESLTDEMRRLQKELANEAAHRAAKN